VNPQSKMFEHLSLWLQSHDAGTIASTAQGVSLVAAKIIALKAQVMAFDNGFVFGGLILLIGGLPLSLMLANSRNSNESDVETPVLE